MTLAGLKGVQQPDLPNVRCQISARIGESHWMEYCDLTRPQPNSLCNSLLLVQQNLCFATQVGVGVLHFRGFDWWLELVIG